MIVIDRSHTGDVTPLYDSETVPGLHGEGITGLLELALIVDLERNESSCRGGREIVCRLLSPAALGGSLRSLLLGIGVLKRKFESVTVDIYVHDSVTGQ